MQPQPLLDTLFPAQQRLLNLDDLQQRLSLNSSDQLRCSRLPPPRRFDGSADGRGPLRALAAGRDVHYLFSLQDSEHGQTRNVRALIAGPHGLQLPSIAHRPLQQASAVLGAWCHGNRARLLLHAGLSQTHPELECITHHIEPRGPHDPGPIPAPTAHQRFACEPRCLLARLPSAWLQAPASTCAPGHMQVTLAAAWWRWMRQATTPLSCPAPLGLGCSGCSA